MAAGPSTSSAPLLSSAVITSVPFGVEEDTHAEVCAVVAGLVYSVSVRNFCEENQQLFEELEVLQRRLWAHDEV